jgi:sterol desaturase/sphingolipid hydroxylase (fatty acid hydroxylase superfamily)
MSTPITTTIQTWIQYGHDSGFLSPLFPLIWLSLPLFFLSCLFARYVEGPETQQFNYVEAKRSFMNSVILGSLYSYGPLMKHFLDENKTEMTWDEMLWKGMVAAFIVDALFYWIHRAMHDIPSLRPLHAQHHERLAKHTVWGGFDEDWFETLIVWGYLTAPFLFLTVTPEFIVLMICGGSVDTALMHSTYAFSKLVPHVPPYPLIGSWFHHTHHVTITKNFGGVFVFWDYVMGTYKEASN